MFGQNVQPMQNDNQIPDDAIARAMGDAKDMVNPSAGSDWQHPGLPLDDQAGLGDDNSQASHGDNNSQDSQSNQNDQHGQNDQGQNDQGHDDSQNDSTPPSADDQVSGDLMDIKQQALSQLTPLVGHLDQSPEEKFRTTMMMIQANDDSSLISEAYRAAQSIEDEKNRAQALLDVVNEINYFTQNKK